MSDIETNKLIRALIDALGYEIKTDLKYYDTDTWKELKAVNGIIEHPPSKTHTDYDVKLIKK